MAEKKIYKRRPIDLTQKNPGFRQIANCITAKDHSIANHEKEGNGVVILRATDR